MDDGSYLTFAFSIGNAASQRKRRTSLALCQPRVTTAGDPKLEDVLVNFRDAAAGFDKIRSGLLFRSAVPQNEESRKLLRGFTLVDLRTPVERKNLRDAHDVEDSENTWIEASLFRGSDFLRVSANQVGWKNLILGALLYMFDPAAGARPYFGQLNALGFDTFLRFLLEASKPRLAETIRLITDESNLPSLTFCTAGKDRTGIVWALLLVVLGASHEQAAADFAVSEDMIKKHHEYYQFVGDKLEVIGMSRDLFMASPYETMRTILATIVEDYGDVESFLDSVGLSFEEQRNIRCRLLKT